MCFVFFEVMWLCGCALEAVVQTHKLKNSPLSGGKAIR